jgi:hypothetical protein
VSVDCVSVVADGILKSLKSHKCEASIVKVLRVFVVLLNCQIVVLEGLFVLSEEVVTLPRKHVGLRILLRVERLTRFGLFLLLPH